MITRKYAWTFAALLSLCFGASLYAQYGDRDERRERYHGRWVYLGSARVDGRRDHDIIHVGRRAGQFAAVQLRVRGGAIDFQRAVVHFGNGTQEELLFRERIPSGGVTRAIDLPGERRVISSLELWYGKASWHTLPRVSLYGMR